MLFLPKNLAALAKLCADKDGRYSMTGPQVREYEGGFYQVTGSDGYRLAVVQGQSEDPAIGPPGQVSPWELLNEAPGGCYQYVVPTKDWLEAFRRCGKDPRNKTDERLGIAAADKIISFATSQGVWRCAPVEGRYPDWKEILPRKAPLCRIRVNTKLLAELLTVASTFCMDGVADLVYYETGMGGMLGVVGKNVEQTFDGLLVCLEIPKAVEVTPEDPIPAEVLPPVEEENPPEAPVEEDVEDEK